MSMFGVLTEELWGALVAPCFADEASGGGLPAAASCSKQCFQVSRPPHTQKHGACAQCAARATVEVV